MYVLEEGNDRLRFWPCGEVTKSMLVLKTSNSSPSNGLIIIGGKEGKSFLITYNLLKLTNQIFRNLRRTVT